MEFGKHKYKINMAKRFNYLAISEYFHPLYRSCVRQLNNTLVISNMRVESNAPHLNI